MAPNEDKPSGENDIEIFSAKRGQSIIDYVSAGLGVATGGLSEAVMLPLRRKVEARLQELEEVLTTDLRKGLISPDDIIDEDRLASFILRVRRGAVEGVGRRKLRLMARIFFKDAASDDYEEDTITDFWLVTEQLSLADIRTLAMLKRSHLAGLFDEPVKDDEPNGRKNRRIAPQMDSDSYFTGALEFNEAVAGLSRFGFIEAASAYGGLAYFATERCIRYLEHIDMDALDVAPTAG